MKEYLEGLSESRNRAWNEAKAVLDAAAAEKRDMTADEKQKFENINADLDAKDAEIRSILDTEERNKEADEQRERIAHLLVPGRKETPEAPAEPDIRSLFDGSAKQVTFDIPAELSAALLEKRDLTTPQASAGDTIPRAQMVNRLYEELIQNTNVFGVSTLITTASGEPMDFPVVKASESTHAKVVAADGSLPVNEATALPEVSPTFDKVSITPAKYGVLLQVSSELAQDTVVDLNGYIARSAAQGIRNNAGKDMVATLVAGATDSGVSYATFGGVSTTGSGYTNLVDLVYSVNQEYRGRGKFFTSDSFVRNVRKILDSNNLPVWSPSTIVGQPDTILGHGVVTDPNMPISGAASKVAVFGDLGTHYIRQVGSIRFEYSTDFAFDTDLVSFRCIWRGGSAVLDTQALKWADITA